MDVGSIPARGPKIPHVQGNHLVLQLLSPCAQRKTPHDTMKTQCVVTRPDAASKSTHFFKGVTYLKCPTLSSNLVTKNGNSAMWKLSYLDGPFCTETAYGPREVENIQFPTSHWRPENELVS